MMLTLKPSVLVRFIIPVVLCSWPALAPPRARSHRSETVLATATLTGPSGCLFDKTVGSIACAGRLPPLFVYGYLVYVVRG